MPTDRPVGNLFEKRRTLQVQTLSANQFKLDTLLERSRCADQPIVFCRRDSHPNNVRSWGQGNRLKWISAGGGGDLIGANSLADIAGTGGSLALARTNISAHNGDNITAGTVADARIASTIARDTETTAATNKLDTDIRAALVAAVTVTD